MYTHLYLPPIVNKNRLLINNNHSSSRLCVGMMCIESDHCCMSCTSPNHILEEHIHRLIPLIQLSNWCNCRKDLPLYNFMVTKYRCCPNPNNTLHNSQCMSCYHHGIDSSRQSYFSLPYHHFMTLDKSR